MTSEFDSRSRLRAGLQWHQSGNTVAAEAAYQDVLQLKPNDVDALHLYGMLLHEQGDSVAALAKIESAIRVRGDSAELFNALCVVWMGLGKDTEAIQAVQRSLQLNPMLPEARRNLEVLKQRSVNHVGADAALPEQLVVQNLASNEREGKVTADCDGRQVEFDEWKRQLDGVLERSDLSLGSDVLGNLLKRIYEVADRQKRPDWVVAACVSTLKRFPHFVPAHLTLGLVFSSRILPEQLRDFGLACRRELMDRSLHHLRIAADLRPCADTYDAWAVALLAAGKHDEAIEKLNTALNLDSRFAKSFENRGRANLERGNIIAARSDYQRAMDLEPTSALSHLDLAKSSTAGPENLDAIADLEKILSRKDLKQEQRSLLHFAAAHRLERKTDFDRAFKHFARANALKNNPADVRSQAWNEKVDDLRLVMDQVDFQSSGSACELSPIFIVSMPRSGTTLTETILGRHRDVRTGGELFEISDIAHTLSRRIGTGLAYPSCLTELTHELAAQIGQEYGEHVRRLITDLDKIGKNETFRFTDKMPTNFWHLGLIARVLPNAKVIHVRRDPKDVFVSCFKQNLTWPFCDLHAIVRYHAAYLKIMEYWNEVLPISIHTVDYETLVTSPETEIRGILKHCDLPWDDSCLDLSASSGSVQTPSKWQVRQPIYRSSIGAWRKYEKAFRTSLP